MAEKQYHDGDIGPVIVIEVIDQEHPIDEEDEKEIPDVREGEEGPPEIDHPDHRFRYGQAKGQGGEEDGEEFVLRYVKVTSYEVHAKIILPLKRNEHAYARPIVLTR